MTIHLYIHLYVLCYGSCADTFVIWFVHVADVEEQVLREVTESTLSHSWRAES